MKHKQHGSVHIIVITGILTVLMSGALIYVLTKSLNPDGSSQATSPVVQSTDKVPSKRSQDYTELKDWGVGFPSNTSYSLKLNSSKTAYFISIQELAKTCTTPETPWLGIIQRFENPDEKQTVGPDAGKTIIQIFGSKGKMINGKLYYFDLATQFCTRGASNPEIEQAAKKLESEIKLLEAY